MALVPLSGRFDARGAAAGAAVVAGLLALCGARAPYTVRAGLYLTAAAGLTWLAALTRARMRAAEAVAHDAEQRLREHEAYLLGASHELRSPLGKAALALEYILSTAGGVHRGIGQVALFELHRLMMTLENMLELARMHSGQATINMRDVDLIELVRERMHAAEGDDAGHVLVFECPGEPLAIRTDPARLAQVLDNLLSNAIKYSPEYTEVCVRIGATPDRVTIAVRDQGLGIAPRDRQRIFDQYYRAVDGRHVSGVGLGLFISRALVTKLGGRIELDSKRGSGSEFRVILPRQASADTSSRSLAPSA